MTFLEHGLYGGAIAYKFNPNLFWFGVAFGVLPDIPPLILATQTAGLRRVAKRILKGGADNFPEYVYKVYDITHSFITTAAIFIILFLITKDSTALAISYGFHIVCDIPFHNSRFSTRFLYPLTNFHIHGYSETKHKWVILAQYPVIILIYVFLLKK